MPNNKLDSWRNGGASSYNTLQKAMNRLFDDFWQPSSSWLTDTSVMAPFSAFSPSCDIEETKNSFIYTLDVPGMKKDDIKIEVLDNYLTISGERKEEQKNSEGSRRYYERQYGQFQRMIPLPNTANIDRVEASYDNGVLRVSIPKMEAAQARQIKIGEGRSAGARDIPVQKERDQTH